MHIQLISEYDLLSSTSLTGSILILRVIIVVDDLTQKPELMKYQVSHRVWLLERLTEPLENLLFDRRAPSGRINVSISCPTTIFES